MRSLLFALLPAAIPGCSVFAPDCTMVGCRSGIHVTFAAPPTQPYRVELLLGDDATEPVSVQECTRAQGDCPPVFFPLHRSGERARLRVTTAAGSVTTTAQLLDYRRTQPNGPDCPPTCFTATLEAFLPGTPTSGDRPAAAI